MPYKLSFFILLALSQIISVAADDGDKVKISAKVIDKTTNQPLEYATISFHPVDTARSVTGGITNANGDFSTRVQAGMYDVHFEFISYQKEVKSNLSLTGNTDLGAIALQPTTTQVGEVQVRAERSQYELRLDKKVFNVGKDLTGKGTSVADLLDNIPSVSVDFEGNISLRGSENVKVLVDGKPSGLTVDNTAEALKMFPSSMVQSVEVITNPSARYDAEGVVGIINIITFQEEKRGLHGSVDVSAGIPDNNRIALNGNYRTGKLNFFGSMGVSQWASPREIHRYREFYNDSGMVTSYFQQFSEGERASTDYLFRYGLDYYISDNSILTNSFSYRFGDEGLDIKNFNKDFDANGQIIDSSFRDAPNTELEQDIEYELRHEQIFDGKDHKLSSQFQFLRSTEDEDLEIIDNSTRFTDTTTIRETRRERTFNDEFVNNYLVQIDYIRPFGNKGKIESGAKSNFRTVESDHEIQRFLNEQWNTVPEFTNLIRYQENIHALYGMFSDEYQKFTYQVGLRMEYSDITINQQSQDTAISKDYTDWFPSLHVTWKLNTKHSIQGSYSRRLSRPGFWDLNPFFNYYDDRNIRTGNTQLNPEYSNVYEFSYLQRYDMFTITTGIYYRATQGLVQRIEYLSGDTTLDGESVFISQPVNLSSEDAYGAELTILFRPMDELTIDGDMNFFKASSQGNFRGTNYDVGSDHFQARLNAKGSIFKNTDLQARFNYRGPHNYVQGRRLEWWALDAGISHDFLNGNATLAFNVRDIFNTRKYRRTIKTDEYFLRSSYQRLGPMYTLSFNYRLNQEKRQDHKGGDSNGQAGF